MKVSQMVARAADGASAYLKNAWYMAAWTADLEKEGINSFTLLGEPLIVFRDDDGEWAALEDMCSHRLVPLSLGRREAGGVRCMYHGLKFAPDGRCVEIPGQRQIPRTACVRSYPAVERHGAVWVWLGDPQAVEPEMIPSIGDVGDVRFAWTYGSVDVASEATLIWDNLLDLTHVAFAHEGSFGESHPAAISAILQAEAANLVLTTSVHGVQSARWHLAKPSYTFLGGKPTDEYVTADFVVPGALIIATRVFPIGTGKHGETLMEGATEISRRVACQVVVPLGEGRSRIHYHSGTLGAPQEIADNMGKLLQKVLVEDTRFIEAQYANMRAMPRRKPMNLAMDQAGVKFRAVMRRLAAEQAPRCSE